MSSPLLEFLGLRGGEGINILFRDQHSVITYPGHFEQQDTSAFFAIHWRENFLWLRSRVAFKYSYKQKYLEDGLVPWQFSLATGKFAPRT